MHSTSREGHLFSFERRVRLGFVLAAIGFAFIGMFSYVSAMRFKESVARINHIHHVLNSLRELLSGLTSAESSQRSYLVTGQEQYLLEYEQAAQQVQARLHELQELTPDNSTQQKNLEALDPLVAERLSRLQAGLGLRNKEGLDAVQAVLMNGQDKQIEGPIHAIISNMQKEENRLLPEREQRAELNSLATRAAIASGSVLGFSLLFVALFIVGRSFAYGRRAETELRLARNTLEERVRERTSEVVQSGAALRAGEERLARVIDSAMDAIITVDDRQRITLFNPAAERMFGCPAGDAIGTPLEQFLPARFRAAHKEHLRGFGQNSVTRRTMGRFSPLRGLRKNGEEFPIEASISQVDVGGRKLFTAIVRDVTETANAQEIGRKLAAIVESSEDAIMSKSLDGLITSWNPAAERLFGYAAKEAIGKPMVKLFPPEQVEEEKEILARIGRGEGIDHYETHRVGKDGKLMEVSVTISPLRDNSGRVVGASTIARNITEHKRAGEELRRQAGLLNLAPALVRDMDDHIEMWTRGAERLYGYSKEEALGRRSYELLKTEFAQALPEIEKALNSTGVWEGELVQQTRGGKRVVVASQWVLHRDAKGKPARVLEVNADITALKQAEALQISSQKLGALGTLAGGIAHDFNNILSAINGSAALAISQFPRDHPVQACLEEIAKAGVRGADLVRRILSFSRPQDRNIEVQALEPVVEEALKLVRATLPAMIEIRTEFGADLPKARVDATQIYQVIVNLVTNAAHAVGDKPGLVVEVKLDAPTVHEDEILLYGQVPAGDYLRLLIGDNGSGMDEATVKRIFDPFFTTKPTGKGTGLGLSVVHGIVTAHHAVLQVYSKPGKGTTFRIYFPAVRGATTAVRVQERAAPSGLGERILFVDDEGVLVFVGTMSLEQNGYKVTGAAHGEAALGELRRNPNGYDAVVTDLSMPGMSGLQLTHQIRMIRPDIPVILTSGYINPEDQAKADRLGIRAILSKPVNTKELLATLAVVFQEGSGLRGNLSS